MNNRCINNWKVFSVSVKNRTQELRNAGTGFDVNLDLKIFSVVPSLVKNLAGSLKILKDLQRQKKSLKTRIFTGSLKDLQRLFTLGRPPYNLQVKEMSRILQRSHQDPHIDSCEDPQKDPQRLTEDLTRIIWRMLIRSLKGSYKDPLKILTTSSKGSFKILKVWLKILQGS